MKRDFEELHKFLRDEEAARLRALKQEAEICSGARRAKTGQEVANLSRRVKDLEEKMEAKDSMRFLQVTETVTIICRLTDTSLHCCMRIQIYSKMD